MNNRIKELRQNLELSQSEFSNKILISQSQLALIENGSRNITDRIIKDICREFKVDYIWLTTGEGNMFINNETDILTAIDNILAGEDEFYKNIVKMVVNLDPDEIKLIKKMAQSLLENQKKD